MNLPNQLSLLRILLTPAFVLFLYFGRPVFTVISFVVFTVASITDYYDGYAARKYGIVSMWGQFLDPLADKILVSSAFICFSNLGYVPAWMVLVIVLRDFLITGLRSYAILKAKPIITSRLAKAKTYMQCIVLNIVYLYHLMITCWPVKLTGVVKFVQKYNVIDTLALSITVLTVFTGAVYLVENRSHLRSIAGSIVRMFAPSDA